MYYDFHSHILPGIDDGASDAEMSLKMLEMEKASGVTTIVATPHFYLSSQKPEDFFSKRDEAFGRLSELLSEDSPAIHLGAEVLYTPSLADIDLKRFCIGNTRYMMVELPYQKLSANFIRSFKSFLNEISHEITPILAHAERYLSFTDADSIYEIMDSDMLVQLNCGSFKAFSPQVRFMSDLIKHGEAHLLGTDCHNVSSRKPNLEQARRFIERKFSKDVFMEFMDNAEIVLSDKLL